MDQGILMELQRVLTHELNDRKSAILTLCQDLVRIASENPPGRHYLECVDRLHIELEHLGIDHQVLEAPDSENLPRANILGFHGTGQRTLYFQGHYDVVPAQHREQFMPVVRNGYLYGRGTADMKAGLAAMIYATALLKELNVPLQGRIGLCLVADEETGGRGGSAYLDRIGLLGQDAVAMFTPEPTSDVIWNANRGAITVRVTVRGTSAHVGLQHQGVNAFERMLQVAAAVQDLKREVELRTTSYHIVPAAASHSILMSGGRVEGGTNFNVVPDACSFTIDRRFNPEEDLETEKARLFAVFDQLRQQGIVLDVDILQEGASSGVAADHPIARTLVDTIEAVTGLRPDCELCPGLLDTRWYARKGIPA